MRNSLLTIISIVSTAAAVTFTLSDQNDPAMASFPLLNTEMDAMATAFLSLLFLPRLKPYWRFVSIESHRTYEPGSRGRLQEKAFYREIYPEYWVRDYGEYALVIETDHYVDDGQEKGHKNIRWEVLGKATEDTMGENKTVRNFLPTINNAPAIDWAGKDSIVGTEITYKHPWWNLWTLAPGSKKTETSFETSVMLVAKHRRQIGIQGPDFGVGGSSPIQSQSTNTVFSSDTSTN